MTESEKAACTKYGIWFGIWNAATFFLPMAIVNFTPIPVPLNWIIAASVLMIGLAFYPLWWKKDAALLCSTTWARQQGIDPASLPMFPSANAGLMFVGAALLLITGGIWWSNYQPPGVWFPYLAEASVPKETDDVLYRVTGVSQHHRIILVTFARQRGSGSDELFAALHAQRLTSRNRSRLK